jgi:hypothetical protein
VGPRAVLDAVVKRKIPSPRRESNPRTPIVQPVAQCYTVLKLAAKGERNGQILSEVLTATMLVLLTIGSGKVQR